MIYVWHFFGTKLALTNRKMYEMMYIGRCQAADLLSGGVSVAAAEAPQLHGAERVSTGCNAKVSLPDPGSTPGSSTIKKL